MYYNYVLRCADNKFYTGCTNNLKDRVARHLAGYVPATKNRRPVKLIAYFALSGKTEAYRFEKYLKTGSGRAFLSKRIIGEVA